MENKLCWDLLFLLKASMAVFVKCFGGEIIVSILCVRSAFALPFSLKRPGVLSHVSLGNGQSLIWFPSDGVIALH